MSISDNEDLDKKPGGGGGSGQRQTLIMPRLRPRSLRDSQREQAGRALVAMFAENNNSNHRNNDSSRQQ